MHSRDTLTRTMFIESRELINGETSARKKVKEKKSELIKKPHEIYNNSALTREHEGS